MVRQTGTDFQFVLNPCKPISIASGPACPFDETANCQIDATTGKSAARVASVTTSVSLTDDNRLKLVQTGGDICEFYGTNRQAIIYLSCGPDIGYPMFVDERACTYTFNWTTSAACPLRFSD